MKALLIQRWQVLALRIESLTFRERVLVFCAAFGLLVGALFLGGIEPALKQQEQALAAYEELQRETLMVREQLTLRSTQQDSRHDRALETMRHEADVLEARLRSGHAGLIPPQRMVETLKSLLTSQEGLRLIALSTLTPTPILKPAAPDAEGKAPAPGVQYYRHGLSLSVAGRYDDLVRYVEALEHLPWAIQWQGIALNGERYPDIVLNIRLSTLSEDTRWASM